jgi:hypothetical protein
MQQINMRVRLGGKTLLRHISTALYFASGERIDCSTLAEQNCGASKKESRERD